MNILLLLLRSLYILSALHITAVFILCHLSPVIPTLAINMNITSEINSSDSAHIVQERFMLPKHSQQQVSI
jgi:hypothetical protein